MKKIKFLLLGIVFILGISFSSASYFSGGIEYHNGVYRNELNGLLTYIYNDEIITIADKFLGQTLYQFSGKVSNTGINYYQIGNNFDFHFDTYYNTSFPADTDLSLYGPDNPLNTGLVYRSNTTGVLNLWGAIDGTLLAQKGPCYSTFHVPTINDGEILVSIINGLYDSFFGDVISYSSYAELTYQNYLSDGGSALSVTSSPFNFLLGGGQSCGNAGVCLDYLSYYRFAPLRCVRNVVALPTSNNRTLEYEGSLEGLPEEEEPPINDNSGYIVITGSNTNSLYYNCLGPVYNTSDGLPPAYCFDSSGELNPGRFQNCFDTLEYIDNGVITHTFCNIDGFQQEVNLIEDGSGYSLVPGENISNFLDYFNSGYSVEYFEEFLNKTGYFFKCPFPYTQKFVVRPKLITLLNGFDLAVPINCAFAGFEKGKTLFTFPNSGHFIQSGPILNFEGENANTLYRFLDFCIIFVFILILSKVFKLFK